MQVYKSEKFDQIKEQLFSNPDFIKKSKINYLDCDCKGLHDGQKLVLVCLDSQCKNRGLMCPVCKQQNHKDHEFVHLKVFLGQLQAKLINRPTQQIQQKNQNSNLSTKTLSQHLNALQIAKKSIMTNLQQCVKNLAQAIKQIQKKIQDEYIRIRRIILSQKSFEAKLPIIYNALLVQQSQSTSVNRKQLKQQINKLTQLLQKNQKKQQMKIANNADKIVQIYVENSNKCTTHLLSIMTDLPKKITQLPIKLKNIVQDVEKTGKANQVKQQYTFSQSNKALSVLLSQDKKSVSILGPEQIGGIVFIDQNDLTSSGKRKVNLKISSSISQSISIGVGDVNKMKLINFTIQQMQNEGLFGICAMGININDVQSPTFVFSQGDIIQMTFDPEQSKILFQRRNGIEREQVIVGLPLEQSKKLQFFVNLLLYGDSVQIVA